MIPFGLVAGFADGQEIRITELAEHGFCFRTLDEIREVKRFRICFYDGFNGMKTALIFLVPFISSEFES